ncbi:kynurenine 3-monooxygenase-like [Photinus pyralis]|uniref:kynurenine 3-monooxygenase-like n=1 Tax=Photinus pyralis TaxID=7054 RepID=UPI001266E8EC|nr:kynurenine 3-monooxygenase-like [Photinus pyralis]
MTTDRKIVIVGGGLVGPVCALYMSKRGYNVTLYECRSDPRECGYTRGRSINLAVSNRARKALRELGLEEDILKVSVPMRGRYLHQPNGKHVPIFYDPKNKECIYSVSRNYLNRRLLDAMGEYNNLQIKFDHKLVDAKIESGQLKFLQTKTNVTIDVRADLIIGADGAYSTMRRYMMQKPMFDYNQTYINHGYVELTITPEYGHLLAPNYLHIWPRSDFMMIALPNSDHSWTVTLFMPFKQFEQLDHRDQLMSFFNKLFPDIVPLIGEEQLVEHFFKIKPSALMYVKCSKFHTDAKSLLLGDAAHAMLPFYGQGMNAGFEDCAIFNSVLEYCNDNISMALEAYTERRRNDAHAICELALYNYVEMRDLVIRPSFRIRKFVDNILFNLFPEYWIPLYNSITFTEMGYKNCISNRSWQDKFILCAFVIISTVVALVAAIYVRL